MASSFSQPSRGRTRGDGFREKFEEKEVECKGLRKDLVSARTRGRGPRGLRFSLWPGEASEVLGAASVLTGCMFWTEAEKQWAAEPLLGKRLALCLRLKGVWACVKGAC